MERPGTKEKPPHSSKAGEPSLRGGRGWCWPPPSVSVREDSPGRTPGPGIAEVPSTTFCKALCKPAVPAKLKL